MSESKRKWTPDEVASYATECHDQRLVPPDCLAVVLLPLADGRYQWALVLPNVDTALDPLFCRDTLLAVAAEPCWDQLANVLGTKQTKVVDLPTAFVDLENNVIQLDNC